MHLRLRAVVPGVRSAECRRVARHDRRQSCADSDSVATDVLRGDGGRQRGSQIVAGLVLSEHEGTSESCIGGLGC
jgi:hypothetical protein